MSPSAIPQFALPDINQQVVLTRRPNGVPQAADFALTEAPRPRPPAAGRFVVRNLYLSVDPAQRGWASVEANYSDPVALGSVMRSLAVAVVVGSALPEIPEGTCLYGWFGWQDYAEAGADQVVARIDHPVPLSAGASLLGINGLTAYLALTSLGRPRSGETLLVSTAAGSVGGFVGQIGRILGCRTIGLTGGADKVSRCLERYGYDAAFDYKATPVEAAIRAAAPDGIDVYFDNVGGPILDIVLRHMRPGGRIVQCGTASVASWVPTPTGPRVEREILTRRLSWAGFVIFDHSRDFAAAAEQLAAWWSDGRLTYDEDIAIGIEAAPSAIAQLYAGSNRGKKLIYVGGPS